MDKKEKENILTAAVGGCFLGTILMAIVYSSAMGASGDSWAVSLETWDPVCTLGEPAEFTLTVERLDDFDAVSITTRIHFRSSTQELTAPGIYGISIPRENFEEGTIGWYSNSSDDPYRTENYLQWEGTFTLTSEDLPSSFENEGFDDNTLLWEIMATPYEVQPDGIWLHYSTATAYVAVDLEAE